MVLSVHLQRSAVAAIANCPVRGQFIGSRSLKPVAPESIWLFQESLIEPQMMLHVKKLENAAIVVCITNKPWLDLRGAAGKWLFRRPL
jgi:hypothetical protein